jgi:hypothetical protein
MKEVAQGFRDSMSNAMDDMANGLAYVFGGRDQEENTPHQDSDLDERIRLLQLEVDKLSNVAGPYSQSADKLRSIKARELEELRILKSRNYFGFEGTAGTDDSASLGWSRVDKNSLLSDDKRFEQNLSNGVTNKYETIEHDGETSFYINNKKLNHGDGIVVGADGRLEVVSQSKLAEYVRDRGITDASVTTNGIDNNGLDAIMMAQASALVVNDRAAQAGRVITQIHIFNDDNISGSPNVPLDFDKPDVQNSLRILIQAGAFSTGGAIIGHSAGAHNISAVIGQLREEDKINATIYTVGGVHTAAYPDRVNGWNDYYNPNDYAIAVARLKLPDVTNPQVIRDIPNSQAPYSRNVNGSSGVYWDSTQQSAGGIGSQAYHSYNYNYQNALRRYYQFGSRK